MEKIFGLTNPRLVVGCSVLLILSLLAQTVPYEYPYYEEVRREVSFIPPPQGIDTTTYSRQLHFEFEEDSVTATVDGVLEERWSGQRGVPVRKEDLGADSILKIGDTVFAFSSFHYRFGRLDAAFISIEQLAGTRYAGKGLKKYPVDEILKRLGQENAPYRVLAEAGGLVTLELASAGMMLLVNLSTGAVVVAEVQNTRIHSSPGRGCLFGRRQGPTDYR